MADNTTFEAFLSSLNLTEEYLQRFKDTGFYDLELIKTLNAEERQQMFDLLGLSNKPGHLLKFKKSLCIFLETLETPSNAPISHGTDESLNTKRVTTTSKSASFIKEGKKAQTS